MPDDYYALLELDRRASAEEIRTAIREQRRVWVRRQSSPDPDRRTLAEQRVRDLDAAEKVLLDAGSRAEYDRGFGSGGRGGRTTGSAEGRGPRRALPPPSVDDSPPTGGAGPPSGTGGSGALNDRRQRAQSLLAEEKFRQAAIEFETVLAADPSDAEARARLGECYLQIERVEEGLSILKELVAAEPENHDLRVTYAHGLYQQAWDGLAEVSEGRLAMSRRQVGLLRRNEREIRRLAIGDPQVESLRSQLASMLTDATRRRKVPSFRKRYYLVGGVVALVLALAGPTRFTQAVGALVVVFIGWLYLQRHRPPMWQVRRKQFRRQTLQRGV